MEVEGGVVDRRGGGQRKEENMRSNYGSFTDVFPAARGRERERKCSPHRKWASQNRLSESLTFYPKVWKFHEWALSFQAPDPVIRHVIILQFCRQLVPRCEPNHSWRHQITSSWKRNWSRSIADFAFEWRGYPNFEAFFSNLILWSIWLDSFGERLGFSFYQKHSQHLTSWGVTRCEIDPSCRFSDAFLFQRSHIQTEDHRKGNISFLCLLCFPCFSSLFRFEANFCEFFSIFRREGIQFRKTFKKPLKRSKPPLA